MSRSAGRTGRAADTGGMFRAPTTAVRSITLRLPLLILALLGVVIAALGWNSYRRLTTTLEQASSDRLSGASAQIVGLLQASLGAGALPGTRLPDFAGSHPRHHAQWR